MHKRTQTFPHVIVRIDHTCNTYLVQTETERCLGMAADLKEKKKKKKRELTPNVKSFTELSFKEESQRAVLLHG